MIKIDFETISQKLEVNIPKELSILNFVDLGKEVVLIGDNSQFNRDNFIYKNDHIKWKKDFVIDRFFPNKDLEIYWTGRTKGDNWEIDERYLDLAILSDPYGSYIVCSINESDFGSIWIEFSEYKEIDGKEILRYYLDDNFISFLSKLERGIFHDRVNDYLPLEKNLYKNWGEDFWRVREDKKL